MLNTSDQKELQISDNRKLCVRNHRTRLDVVAHTFNVSTFEAEASEPL